MATPQLQQDPAEGAREVIDRELARQAAGGNGKHSGAETAARATRQVKSEDVQRLLPDLDEWAIAEIVALQPAIGELEQAIAWDTGQGDLPGKAAHPLSGKAAAIFEILNAIAPDSTADEAGSA